jgi:hypothetical protein
MKTLKHLTLEIAFYFLALLVGAVMRFMLLGQASLSDSEAALALQAFDLSKGVNVTLSGQPAYLLLSRLMFSFFGASNFLARFWPAVAGCGLILTAWMARDLIGRKPALLLAFFLALNPGLVAVSREAGSYSLMLVCLTFFLLFTWRKSAVGMGIFGGLTLLCGPQLWPGLLGMVFLVWLSREWSVIDEFDPKPINWRLAAGYGTTCFILVGTIFLIEPRGLSAAAGSLAEYIRGWGNSSGVPVPRMLGVLLAYDLAGLVFGLAGVIYAVRKGDRLDRLLGVWWAAALILALVYPARVPFDLAWSWLPMLVLAARHIPRLWTLERENWLPAAGQAAVAVVLGFFLVYSLLKVPTQFMAGSTQISEPVLKIIVALVMLIALTALVAWGWSVRAAFTGLGWGFGIILSILWLSASFHTAGISRHPQSEFIRSSPYVLDADLIQDTIRQTGQWRPDPTTSLDLAVIGVNSPAMRWELRNYPKALFTDIIAVDSQPEVVITPWDTSLELTAGYRGQELIWNLSTAWDLVAPGEWLQWLLYRDLPVESQEYQRIILWVNTAAFPGGAEEAVPVEAPVEPDLLAPDAQ